MHRPTYAAPLQCQSPLEVPRAVYLDLYDRNGSAVGVQDDFGDQEAEDNKGRAKEKMVEIEEGRLL